MRTWIPCRVAVLLVAAGLVGCAGGESDVGGAAGSGSGGKPAACSTIPSPDAAWIESYERSIVGKLSGEEPIAPGVLLHERASDTGRTTARAFLVDELIALGLDPELRPYDFGPAGVNVVATLPSTTGGSSNVVLGAHFDGIFDDVPAAADNATGVAVVLSLARYLSSIDCRDESVILAFFDQEELGLIGSHVVAEELRTDAVEVRAVHNFDMLSWDDDGDGAIELWSPDPSLAEAYGAVGAELGVDVDAVDCGCSDQDSFIEAGFPATGVSERFMSGDTTPYYHTPEDRFDKVNFSYLVGATKLAATVVSRQVAAAAR